MRTIAGVNSHFFIFNLSIKTQGIGEKILDNAEKYRLQSFAKAHDLDFGNLSFDFFSDCSGQPHIKRRKDRCGTILLLSVIGYQGKSLDCRRPACSSISESRKTAFEETSRRA